MGFVEYVKTAWEIITLKEPAINSAADDEKATMWSIVFVILAGAAMAIGGLNPLGIIVLPIFCLIGSFVWTAVLWVFAKIFGGKGTYMETYRPLGLAYVAMWITIIPILGALVSMFVGIWMIVVEIMVIKNVQKLSTGKAAAVVLIPVAIIMVIAIVIAVLFAAAFLAFFGAAAGGATGAFGAGALT